MSLSQAVAGGSRNADATRAFLSPLVNFGALDKPSTPPSTSSYGWKIAYINRIWDEDGPKGLAAKAVLAVLWKHSDQDGRTWLGLPLLAKKAGIGNLRTARSALERLEQEGWPWYGQQTWASLTAEQKAAGRPVPRRSNGGQAPNLYVLLDGRGQPVTSPSQGSQPARPGLVRTSQDEPSETVVGQNCPGGSEQNCPGGGRAKLPYDPDLSGTRSQEVSAESAAGAPNSTHDFSKAQGSKGDWGWLEAWNVIVHGHAERTKGVYGLAPMSPDLSREQRKSMAECLDGAATELAAKLRSRGVERELVEVRRELAERTIGRYFRNDTPYLRKTKHALRDLPREFHARLTEAMHAISRESHDAANVPRRTAPLEQLAQGQKAEIPAQVRKSESAEKPLPVDVTRAHAGQLLEMLAATSPKDEAPKAPSKADERASSTGMERSPETALGTASPTVQRSTGRVGAPRWGAMVPTPTKVRTVSRLQLFDPEAVESPEAHPRK
ncbi:MAG TPA: helix-turn-helix domain-containing protein [Polyangium sp.]|nr:helix-turn-helix domain-containing protein [Polyangium sp.]